MQFFVVDGPMPFGVGCALDQEDRAAAFNAKRLCDVRRGDDRLKPIFRLGKWQIVFIFEQRKDRFGVKVVRDHLLPDFARQVGFIEGHGYPIGQPDTLNSRDEGADWYSKLPGNVCIGRHHLMIQQLGSRSAAEGLHIFYEAGQLGQFLRDLRLCDERAFTSPYFDYTAGHEILNRFADRCAADFKALN